MIALPNPTVSEFLDRTYQPHHLLRPSTLGFYRGVIASLAKFAIARGYCAAPLRLGDLNEELVLAWRLDGQEVEQRSPATLNSRRGALLAIWRFAHERGLAQEPPRIKKLKEPKRRPKAWALTDMEALTDACFQAKAGRGWEGRHWLALVLVIYDTGIRIGAALKLKIGQLDLERAILGATPDQQKDNEEAAWPLFPSTVEWLRTSLADRPLSRGELLFPWPYSRRKIWRDYDRILAAAGLPNTRRDKFHRLRRTSASWLESVRPGAAQAHLGHSDASTTRRYLDPEITGAGVNAAALLPRFTLPAPERQGLLF